MAEAEYKFLIDWRNEGLYDVSNFEYNMDGWDTTGSTPPSIELSSEQSYSGSQSMKINWLAYNPFIFGSSSAGFGAGRFGNFAHSNSASVFTFGDADRGFGEGRFGFAEVGDSTFLSPRAVKTVSGLTVGRDYTLSAWMYVDFESGVNAKLVVEGIGESLSTDAVEGFDWDTWVKVEVAFTATSTSHVIKVKPTFDPFVDDFFTYVDKVAVEAAFLDTTARVRDSGIEVEYGRDAARNMDQIQPGEIGLELNNWDRRYTPDYEGSVLFGDLGPGKPVLLEASYNGRSYGLFRGFLDGYALDVNQGLRIAELDAYDVLARLAQQKISTPVYNVLTTGEAIHKVLDAAGWSTEARDIDPGATSVRYFYAEDEDPLSVIQALVESEGPPALISVSSTGAFIFRDRHHRLTRTASIDVQATFSPPGEAEPVFASPFEYDLGFTDVINSISIPITERVAGVSDTVVWEAAGDFVITNSTTHTEHLVLDNPVIDAIVPVLDTDYTVADLGTAEVTLSRTSGQSLKIDIKAVGGTVVVRGLRLRATPIEGVEYKVELKDEASIERYGEKSYDEAMPWASRPDAEAVANVILGARSERLPTATFDVHNVGSVRMTQILQRDLSDRIHIVETETCVDHDFYIERIAHKIEQAGKHHVATFGCERVRQQLATVFTFDDASRGFDSGVFGYTGLSNPDTVFILDQSDLDEGVLAF